MRLEWLVLAGLLLAGPVRAASGLPTPTRTILGFVTDMAGEPIGFATVTVPGTSLGAQTNGKGSFTIRSVPIEFDSLRAVRMGYQARGVRLAGYAPDDTLRIQLAYGTAVPIDSALAARVADALVTTEKVRVYVLVGRPSTTSYGVREVRGVGRVRSELNRPDVRKRMELARWIRRAGKGGCGLDWRPVQLKPCYAVAVLAPPTPFIVEISEDGMQCNLRRDGDRTPTGQYQTRCVADSLLQWLDGLTASRRNKP